MTSSGSNFGTLCPSIPNASVITSKIGGTFGLSSHSQLLKPSCAHAPSYNHTQLRTVKYAYKPNALKRIRKNGLEKRINSNQQEMLFRKFVKGNHRLTVFDRFMNEVPRKPNGRQKRVVLSDKGAGFRAFIKEQEYYRF